MWNVAFLWYELFCTALLLKCCRLKFQYITTSNKSSTVWHFFVKAIMWPEILLLLLISYNFVGIFEYNQMLQASHCLCSPTSESPQGLLFTAVLLAAVQVDFLPCICPFPCISLYVLVFNFMFLYIVSISFHRCLAGCSPGRFPCIVFYCIVCICLFPCISFYVLVYCCILLVFLFTAALQVHRFPCIVLYFMYYIVFPCTLCFIVCF